MAAYPTMHCMHCLNSITVGLKGKLEMLYSLQKPLVDHMASEMASIYFLSTSVKPTEGICCGELNYLTAEYCRKA